MLHREQVWCQIYCCRIGCSGDNVSRTINQQWGINQQWRWMSLVHEQLLLISLLSRTTNVAVTNGNRFKIFKLLLLLLWPISISLLLRGTLLRQIGISQNHIDNNICFLIFSYAYVYMCLNSSSFLLQNN